MSDVSLRPAGRHDTGFLAIAMQAADRGHTGIGSWDVMLPGAEEDRLAILAELAGTDQPSYVHWSTFLVADIDDRPVGTVAGYVPELMTFEHFRAACRGILDANGKLREAGAWSRDYFTVNIPKDTLRVEWVYTDPGFRGMGVSSRLIAELLNRARADGMTTAHVGTYIGNAPAIATYRRAGFDEFAECRHLDYEHRFKAPGLVFFRRSL
jgi:GNAT superfamily N-acetyltransferase